MIEQLASSVVLHWLFLVALSGLAFAILAEQLQLFAKYKGALNQRIAYGYNLAMKVMVVNRLGAVLYFLLIAFNIDNGLSAESLAAGYIIAIIFVAAATGVMLVFLQRMSASACAGTRILNPSQWAWPIVIASFVAVLFNVLGLTVPWLAGALYPDIRLTLANTSFLFNTLFTIVNVFYIEHRFAKVIDRDIAQVHGFVAGVMVGRLAAFLFVAIGLMIALKC